MRKAYRLQLGCPHTTTHIDLVLRSFPAIHENCRLQRGDDYRRAVAFSRHGDRCGGAQEEDPRNDAHPVAAPLRLGARRSRTSRGSGNKCLKMQMARRNHSEQFLTVHCPLFYFTTDSAILELRLLRQFHSVCTIRYVWIQTFKDLIRINSETIRFPFVRMLSQTVPVFSALSRK